MPTNDDDVTPVARPPEVSPTGQAILPQWIVKWAVPLVAVAGTVGYMPEVTGALHVPALLVAACRLVFVLGGALGIASQGARK